MPTPPLNVTTVASFYDELTAKLCGGVVSNNGHNDPDAGNPDVTNHERGQHYESKGSISSDCHKVRENQVGHYEFLNRQTFPIEDPESYYFFWEYKGRGIADLTDQELKAKLRRDTSRLTVFTVELVRAQLGYWDTTGSAGWPEYHMHRSSARTEMHEDPEAKLREMNIDPDELIIRRLEVKVSRKEVPALIVRHKTTRGLSIEE